MSADVLLSRWTRAARLRGAGDDIAVAAPAFLAAAVIVWRLAGMLPAIVIAVLGLGLVVALSFRRAARFDEAWLARQLDAQRADMEDSAGLLFTPGAALNPLQVLQRDRVARRIADDADTDLRPVWSSRRIALAWGAAVIVAALAILWPGRDEAPAALAPSSESVNAPPGVPRLVAQRLRVVPPAYTGLPPRNEARLDARVPAGSRLVWTLRFAPPPGGASLAFHGGRPLALRRAGGDWSAELKLDRSALYRVMPDGGETKPLPPLHRLDAVPDSPPQIKVVAPDRTLTLMTPGQKRWPLTFEVSDDYGVSATARLRIITAQGEGENIVFKERTIALRGTGGAKQKRFTPTLDLASFGFSKGGDLVAQLIVGDNRTPGPQVVRSPSLILRWPGDLGQETSGLDGMVKKVMPAYFRSQRQIIIDTEKLIAERRRIQPDLFVERSDKIGVDQRLLRLRYGKFLGEEADDGPTAPTSDGAASQENHGGDEAPSAPAKVGDAGAVMEQFGHTHDESEAATLLDPETRSLLKQALDNMWQSELNLRQGKPQAALPFAYKALRFIKQVQQATRIYLARVGPDLPPIDESRRMTGKREGLESRVLPLSPKDGADAVPAAAWRALGSNQPFALEPLERWLTANPARVADPLAFAIAIDAVRRDPGCATCRWTLRGHIWSVLAIPPPRALRREAPDAEGLRYLDAIGAGA